MAAAAAKVRPGCGPTVARSLFSQVQRGVDSISLAPPAGRPGCPYRVLIFGDGDLSFASYMASFLEDRCAVGRQDNDHCGEAADQPTSTSLGAPQAQLVATTFDSQQVIGEKHPSSVAHREQLERLGHRVLHGVDATDRAGTQNLLSTFLPFDEIIFNFPHVGGKSPIKKNRLLLKHTFETCDALLGDNGVVCVTLCKGQGGTSFDVQPRLFGNHWRILQQAAFGPFQLIAAAEFHPDDLQGYRSSGYRSQDRGFRTRQGLSHFFCRPFLAGSLPAPDTFSQLCDRDGFHECECLFDRSAPQHSAESTVKIPCRGQDIDYRSHQTLSRLVSLLETTTESSTPPHQMSQQSTDAVSRLFDMQPLSCHRHVLTCQQLSPHFEPWNYPIFHVLCLQVHEDDVSRLTDALQQLIEPQTKIYFEKTPCLTDNEPLVDASLAAEYKPWSKWLPSQLVHEFNSAFQAPPDIDAAFQNKIIDLIYVMDVNVPENDDSSKLVLVHLERLACIVDNLKELRQLWWQPLVQHRPACMEAPVHVHDISFWVPDDWSEAAFRRLFWDIGGDLCQALWKIDEHTIEDRVGLCFRCVYGGETAPVSFDRASTIQHHFRRTVQDVLGVTLR